MTFHGSQPNCVFIDDISSQLASGLFSVLSHAVISFQTNYTGLICSLKVCLLPGTLGCVWSHFFATWWILISPLKVIFERFWQQGCGGTFRRCGLVRSHPGLLVVFLLCFLLSWLSHHQLLLFYSTAGTASHELQSCKPSSRFSLWIDFLKYLFSWEEADPSSEGFVFLLSYWTIMSNLYCLLDVYSFKSPWLPWTWSSSDRVIGVTLWCGQCHCPNLTAGHLLCRKGRKPGWTWIWTHI